MTADYYGITCGHPETNPVCELIKTENGKVYCWLWGGTRWYENPDAARVFLPMGVDPGEWLIHLTAEEAAEIQARGSVPGHRQLNPAPPPPHA